ncbi:MAG: hypothetical protein R3C53_01030 [Pirellulaceae bacterium]
MPRTAATENIDRAQQRHSARLRATSVTENTPVLFRLPSIERLPVPLSVPSDVQPLVGSDGIPAPAAAVSASHQPPSISTNSQLESSTAAPSEATLSEVPNSVNERSWWEHWSSGVVLILLVIALIAASIIAFSDSQPTDPDLLADTSASIEDTKPLVPVLQIDSAPMPAKPESSTPLTNSAIVDASANSQARAELDFSAEPPQLASTSLIPADLESGATFGGSELNVDDEQSSVDSIANSGATGAELLLPTLGDQRDQPTANLNQPVAIEEPSLFTEHPTGNSDIAAAPTTTPVAGQSPSLYDDALLGLGGSSVSPATPENLPIDTGVPAYTAALASGPATPKTSMASFPNSSEASAPTPASPPSAGTPTMMPGVKTTLTPESDAESFIRAWQQYNALNQAQAGAVNRFVSPQTEASPSSPTPSTNVGGQRSYTLGGTN